MSQTNKHFEWTIKNATHVVEKMKPGKRFFRFFTLDNIKWGVSFYPHGKLDRQGQERKNSSIYLNYQGETLTTFDYSFKMTGHRYLMLNKPEVSQQFTKGETIGFLHFIPRNELSSCVTPEDTLVITVNLLKK